MNRTFKSLDDLARHLEKLVVTHDLKALSVNHAVAENTKEHIQGVLGDPEKLAPNAASTIARKGKDAPLVDTGEMRLSYQSASGLHEAAAGTPDIKALWHEYGLGSKYPARPANRIGAHEAEKSNHALYEAFGHAILGDDRAILEAAENAKRGIV